MTELKINLPDQLFKKTFEVSKSQNIPVDGLIAASLAQKLFKFIPDPYLEERAKREGLSEVLSQVPDLPAEKYDKL